MKKHNAHGFAVTGVILLTVIIASIAGLGFYVYRFNSITNNQPQHAANTPEKATIPPATNQVANSPDTEIFENNNFKLNYQKDWGWQLVAGLQDSFCANSPETETYTKACYTGAFKAGAIMEARPVQPTTNEPKIDSVDPNKLNKHWTITKQGWITLNNIQTYQFEVSTTPYGSEPAYKAKYTRVPYPNSQAWLEFRYAYTVSTGDKYAPLYEGILKSIELKSSTPTCCG